jgi:methylmalonyl-CoA/ethylmalonyl-CoA epimerase
MGSCRIEHIGIVVKDLERSLALLEALLGLEAAGVQEMEEVGLRVASLQAENIRIELLQYTSGGSDFGRRVMGPGAGYNHIAVQVEEMAPALEKWASAGARVQEGFPRAGSHGRVAFFEEDSTGGLLLELCEP